MSLLAKKITSLLVEHLKTDGTFDRIGVLDEVKPRLSLEEKDGIIDAHLLSRIDDLSNSAVKRLREKERKPTQLRLFPSLALSYPLADGSGVKMTARMKRAEFVAIIEMRKLQIKADRVSVQEMERALLALDKVWRNQPALDVEQCHDELARQSAVSTETV